MTTQQRYSRELLAALVPNLLTKRAQLELRLRGWISRVALWMQGWLTRRLFRLEQVATDLEYGDLVRLKVLPNSADAFVVLAVNTEAAAIAAVPVGYDPNDIVHVYALRDVERLRRAEDEALPGLGAGAFSPQPPESA